MQPRESPAKREAKQRTIPLPGTGHPPTPIELSPEPEPLEVEERTIAVPSEEPFPPTAEEAAEMLQEFLEMRRSPVRRRSPEPIEYEPGEEPFARRMEREGRELRHRQEEPPEESPAPVQPERRVALYVPPQRTRPASRPSTRRSLWQPAQSRTYVQTLFPTGAIPAIRTVSDVRAQRQLAVVESPTVSVTPSEDEDEGAEGRQRAICWCFTAYTEQQPRLVIRHGPRQAPSMDYICSQLEQCPTTGTMHWQGYVEYSRRVSKSTVEQDIGGLKRVFVEMRVEAQNRAIEYTRAPKPGYVPNTWVEEGTKHASDAAEMPRNVLQMIQGGATKRDIGMLCPRMLLQFPGGLQAMFQEFAPPPKNRRIDPLTGACETWLYWGVSGSGKTHKARNDNPNHYCKPHQKAGSAEWWNGYRGEKCIILDEFTGQIEYEQFKQLTDYYALQVPVKYGFVNAEWDKVIICSNRPRDSWYPKLCKLDKGALKRRLPDCRCIYMTPDKRGEASKEEAPPLEEFLAPELPKKQDEDDIPMTDLFKIRSTQRSHQLTFNDGRAGSTVGSVARALSSGIKPTGTL